jgi:hypothetical protein
VNEVATQKLEEAKLAYDQLYKWYNKLKCKLKYDTDEFTKYEKKFTGVRKVIKNMTDTTRIKEELSIMDSTEINGKTTVAEIKRNQPRLQQPMDIWGKFWDIVCRPRLLHDSITSKEANILKEELDKLRIADTSLESDIDVNKIRQTLQTETDFKHRQKKWIEDQIGRFISEIRISTRNDLIDKLSHKVSGVVPFQILEKCKPFCEQLSSHSYHEAKALYGIIIYGSINKF